MLPQQLVNWGGEALLFSVTFLIYAEEGSLALSLLYAVSCVLL